MDRNKLDGETTQTAAEDAAATLADCYYGSRHDDGWKDLKMAFLSGVAFLQKENTKLQKENELLRGTLIRTPEELHKISKVVESYGFGKRELI